MAAVHKFGPILEKLQDPRYIVLTVENCPLRELRRGIDDLFLAFERLRHSKLWAEVRGALAVLEITFNERESTWHPHINVVADSPFIEKADLDAAWFRSTEGKGRITWIERADHKTVFELIKYVTKLADFVHIPEAVEWFLNATHGKRFIRTYGSLYGIKLEQPDSEESEEPQQTPCPDCGSSQVEELPTSLRIDDVYLDASGTLRFGLPVDDTSLQDCSPRSVVMADG
jgi:hypothetical protein